MTTALLGLMARHGLLTYEDDEEAVTLLGVVRPWNKDRLSAVSQVAEVLPPREPHKTKDRSETAQTLHIPWCTKETRRRARKDLDGHEKVVGTSVTVVEIGYKRRNKTRLIPDCTVW